jgi:hypothetical protein
MGIVQCLYTLIHLGFVVVIFLASIIRYRKDTNVSDILYDIGVCVFVIAFSPLVMFVVFLFLVLHSHRFWAFVYDKLMAQLIERWQPEFENYGIHVSFEVHVQDITERLRGFNPSGEIHLWFKRSPGNYKPRHCLNATTAIVRLAFL